MNDQNKRILEMLSNGVTVKEIAALLELSDRTIEHKLFIMRIQYASKSTLHLVAKYIRGEILLTDNTKV